MFFFRCNAIIHLMSCLLLFSLKFIQFKLTLFSMILIVYLGWRKYFSSIAEAKGLFLI